jgi:hypothetical protein
MMREERLITDAGISFGSTLAAIAKRHPVPQEG